MVVLKEYFKNSCPVLTKMSLSNNLIILWTLRKSYQMHKNKLRKRKVKKEEKKNI